MTEAAQLADTTTTEIVEYNPVAAGLADLRRRFGDVAWDLSTTKGDKEARAARKELVSLRTSLEAKRRELKAPALERSRLIDAEAKRITAEILAIESPIDEQIRADEVRREAERREKAEAEASRVAALRERVDAIKSFPVRAAGRSSIVIRALLDDLLAIEIDESFEESRGAAGLAHADALAALHELHAAAEAGEAEARRLREERAELERLRAEQAERARIERERIAAEQKAAADNIAAERAALESHLRELRKAEEGRAAEQRRFDEQRQAEEQSKLEAQRAEIDKQQEKIASLRREQAEREATERKRIDDERAAREASEAAEKEAEARFDRERLVAAARIRQARESQLREAAPDLLAAAKLALGVLERADPDEEDREEAIAALRSAIDAAEVVDAEILA